MMHEINNANYKSLEYQYWLNILWYHAMVEEA